jgi:hypothetical protein
LEHLIGVYQINLLQTSVNGETLNQGSVNAIDPTKAAVSVPHDAYIGEKCTIVGEHIVDLFMSIHFQLCLVDTSYAGLGNVEVRVISKENDKSVSVQRIETDQQCLHKFTFTPEVATVYQGN